MKRKIFIFAAIVPVILFFILLIAVISINAYTEHIAKPYINTADGHFDAIVIPGARVRGTAVSTPLKARLDKGLELYRAGYADKLIVSGDHGTKEYDEVNAMREYLMKNGVVRSDIFMDHAGFDTYATVYRARDVFCADRIIFVSQEYHNVRAAFIADRLGIELYAQNAADPYYNKLRFIREPLARVKSFIEAQIIQPKPKFLGDAIPVSGDGSITDDGLT